MLIVNVNIKKILNIFSGDPNFVYDAKKIDPSEKTTFDLCI
jgi:hypothetical protein